MKYPEEDFAVDLHRELTRHFGGTSTVLAIGGAGVHWHCTASRGRSSCSIECFGSGGPEYYTDFNRDSKDVATARTASRDGTIAAVADWLDGQDLASLHERYAFVDETKRALSQIRAELIASVPELRSGDIDLQHQAADIYYLLFRDEERSCLISFYGKNESPDAKFSWADCQLFEFQPRSTSQLASVLKRWVCEHYQPSSLRREFPWLEIGKLADFYENGRPIEGEFILSWDSIEAFYQQGWCEFSEPVLAMIRAMRNAGYDRVLRAGQSLSSFGLSRSRRHGLRTGQHRIWFHFHRGVTMDAQADFVEPGLTKHPIQFTEHVRRLVDRLAGFDID